MMKKKKKYNLCDIKITSFFLIQSKTRRDVTGTCADTADCLSADCYSTVCETEVEC